MDESWHSPCVSVVSKKGDIGMESNQQDQQGYLHIDPAGGVTARIRDATQAEREMLLNELQQQAEASNDVEDWNRLAIGLLAADRVDEALNLFNQIVQVSPDKDVYRLNLATTYTQARQFEMAKYHMRYLAEHGTTKEWRHEGLQQLENLERTLRQTEQAAQFRQLQTEGLREKIDAGQASPDDYQLLARLFYEEGQYSNAGIAVVQLTSLLEEGHRRFPHSTAILELLIYCYLQDDPNNRLEATLKELEAIAPDAGVLQLLRNVDDASAAQERQRREQRADALLGQVLQAEDPALKRAALEDLRQIVNLYPTNPSYRLNLAFGLCIIGECTEAIQHAERVEPVIGESHSMHFNIGQIFWLCGDPVRGRHHLELAEQFAADDTERQDARERIADLEKSKK